MIKLTYFINLKNYLVEELTIITCQKKILMLLIEII
jgi:hypothetical protein